VLGLSRLLLSSFSFLEFFRVVETSHSLITDVSLLFLLVVFPIVAQPESFVVSLQDVVERIIEHRLKFEKRNATRSKKELNYIQEKDKKEFVAEL
jgi:elongation factor P--beta-lysine ligase